MSLWCVSTVPHRSIDHKTSHDLAFSAIGVVALDTALLVQVSHRPAPLPDCLFTWARRCPLRHARFSATQVFVIFQVAKRRTLPRPSFRQLPPAAKPPWWRL